MRPGRGGRVGQPARGVAPSVPMDATTPAITGLVGPATFLTGTTGDLGPFARVVAGFLGLVAVAVVRPIPVVSGPTAGRRPGRA